MPTRISAGVGDHPCFLTFYNYDPYDRKITNFSLYLYKVNLTLQLNVWPSTTFI